MKKTFAFATLITFCLTLGAGLSFARKKKQKAKKPAVKEHYMAMIDPSESISISIQNYSTNADIQNFAQAYVRGGKDALRHALDKNKVGFFHISNGRSDPLVIVRPSSAPSGRSLDIIGIAPTFVATSSQGQNSLPYLQGYGVNHYPYTYIHLQLGADGKDRGWMYMFAKLTFGKQGQVHINSDPSHSGQQLFDIRRLKK